MQTMNTKTGLLEIHEAAARLRVCRRVLYRLIQRKALPPPLKVGRKSLVLESDVEAFIASLIAKREKRA